MQTVLLKIETKNRKRPSFPQGSDMWLILEDVKDLNEAKKRFKAEVTLSINGL